MRMLCVLSLALASVLHVVGDFRSAHPNLGQTVVSIAQDGQGTDGSLTAEACHSCSIVSDLTAGTPGFAASTSHVVPEGRVVQVFPISLRIVGPPPKS